MSYKNLIRVILVILPLFIIKFGNAVYGYNTNLMLSNNVSPIAAYKNNQANYYLSAGNSTVGILDDGGNLTNSFKYQGYGDSKSEKQVDRAQSFLLNGEYTDNDTGLIYLRSRFYNPKLMRFMNADNYQITNLYNFGNGDPINNIDPSGHIAKWLKDLLMGGSIVAGIAVAGGGAYKIINLRRVEATIDEVVVPAEGSINDTPTIAERLVDNEAVILENEKLKLKQADKVAVLRTVYLGVPNPNDLLHDFEIIRNKQEAIIGIANNDMQIAKHAFRANTAPAWSVYEIATAHAKAIYEDAPTTRTWAKYQADIAPAKHIYQTAIAPAETKFYAIRVSANRAISDANAVINNSRIACDVALANAKTWQKSLFKLPVVARGIYP